MIRLVEDTTLTQLIRLLEETGIDPAPLTAQTDALAAQGKKVLYFADETQGKLLNVIAVADTPRPSGVRAVASGRPDVQLEELAVLLDKLAE